MTTFARLSALLIALLAWANPVSAQSIADRVAGAPDGVVRMTFATRDGVCGDGGQNISTGGNRRVGTWNSSKHDNDVEWDDDCHEGPARVVMQVTEGTVTKLRTYVGGRWKARSGVTDLGVVSARAAAEYLLHLAATGDTRAAKEAVFPAALADSIDVAPPLLRLARDETRSREIRRNAVFWVSQAASDAATKGLAELTDAQAVDREVREQAVFALSQRPRDEGVPALIRVARTNKDPEVRRKAIFWLGQSDDPRAMALFEELLLKKP